MHSIVNSALQVESSSPLLVDDQQTHKTALQSEGTKMYDLSKSKAQKCKFHDSSTERRHANGTNVAFEGSNALHLRFVRKKLE